MYQLMKGRRRRAAVAAPAVEGDVEMPVPVGRRQGACAGLIAVGVIGLVSLIPSAAQAAGAAAIEFSPSSYDYGTIDSGATASHTFTLTNTGGTATRALTVPLTGSSAFSKTADTCTATSLGPKKSCTVTVQYAPTTAGATDTATLKASSKQPTPTATASLTGASPAAKSQSQRDCESFGATFATGIGLTVWTCNGGNSVWSNYDTLRIDCWADGGRYPVLDVWSGPPIGAKVTCTRSD